MTITEIIERLESNNSSTFKKAVLDEYTTNDLWNSILQLTYDTSVVFNTSPASMNIINQTSPMESELQLQLMFEVLGQLTNGQTTAKKAKERLEGMLDKDHVDILHRILKGSIAKGVSIKTINDVYGKNWIREWSYQRCSDHKSLGNIHFPAIAQLKSDGAFYNVIVYPDQPTQFLSRNGKELENIYLSAKMAIPVFEPIVFTCEMLINRDGKILPREIGNGLITKLVNQKSTLATLIEKDSEAKTMQQKAKTKTAIYEAGKEWSEIEQSIVFRCWDAIPYDDWVEGKCETPYSERFDYVKRMSGLFYEATPYRMVDSLEEIQAYYDEVIAQGEEGLVVKNLEAIWEDGTSKDQIKLKEKKQCELKIVGYNIGEGEFTGGIGSYICESADGLVKVNISGMKRHQRGLEPVDPKDASKGLKLIDGFDLDACVGQIITVEFNQLLRPKADGTSALFLPVVVEFRTDKREADTYDTIRSM